MNKFRPDAPERKCTKTYSYYGNFKPYLATDFLNRCGYTDTPDFWFGGQNNFHIDHFVPWKNYPSKPELKNSYSNLIYCCSYVNILKSNDEGYYLDPCDNDFNDHFYRDSKGTIFAKPESPKAIYMHKKLKLFLQRYEIIWMLEMIFEKMEKLQSVIESALDGDFKNECLMAQGELAGLMLKYKKYLSKSL